MKKHLLILCALLPVLASAEVSTPRPDVDELLTLMRIDKMMESTMEPLKKMMASAGQTAGMPPEHAARAKAMQEKSFALIMGEMTGSRMKAEMAQIYGETFTTEEIKGLTTFYKSPAGQAFLDKQPIVMQKTMAMSQKMMMEIMPKIQAMMAADAKTASEQKKSLPAAK
jgi:hypothetical protein